jgi:hypothetical protein
MGFVKVLTPNAWNLDGGFSVAIAAGWIRDIMEAGF